MEIKDYLHLYFGQKCTAYEADDSPEGFHYVINEKTIRWVNDPPEYGDVMVKPHLRPIESMTVAEAKESYKIVFKVESVNYDNDTVDYMVAELYDQMRSELFVWALKKGFDIFELIKAGLALDATTITYNEKKP